RLLRLDGSRVSRTRGTVDEAPPVDIGVLPGMGSWAGQCQPFDLPDDQRDARRCARPDPHTNERDTAMVMAGHGRRAFGRPFGFGWWCWTRVSSRVLAGSSG